MCEWVKIRSVCVRACVCLKWTRSCEKLRPIVSINSHVCVAAEGQLCHCSRINPVLPVLFPCGLRLTSTVSTAALGSALHYTLNHLKDLKHQKTPSAANSPWPCGSCGRKQEWKHCKHLILLIKSDVIFKLESVAALNKPALNHVAKPYFSTV